tara:strand:- start:3183 stop:3416 length:234 start_codon:yes stop_codon:yes gene_type:complete
MNYFDTEKQKKIDNWKKQICVNDSTNEEIIEIFKDKCISCINNFEYDTTWEKFKCVYEHNNKKTKSDFVKMFFNNLS